MYSLPSSNPALAVVADDLTGAADTGVQFARVGWHTHVWLRGRATHAAGAAVFDTNTRSSTPDAAARDMGRIGRSLGASGVGLVYKKIDSTIRGNVGAETSALLRALGRRLAVVAPAFPANRRTSRNGVLLVDGVPVHQTAAARDPAHPMRYPSIAAALRAGAGLPVVEIGLEAVRGSSLPDALRCTHGFAVIDAETDADLAAIADAVLVLGPDLLPVGSAGLAAQLAARIAPPGGRARGRERTSAARPLLVCGSLNPVTSAQVECVASELPVLSPFDRPDAADDLRRGPVLLATNARRLEEPAPVVARRLARRVVGLVDAAHPDALLLTGGDIARAVLDALRVDGIELVDELLPGMPIGRAVGGRIDGLPVITKAGGFGPPDALARALRYLTGGTP